MMTPKGRTNIATLDITKPHYTDKTTGWRGTDAHRIYTCSYICTLYSGPPNNGQMVLLKSALHRPRRFHCCSLVLRPLVLSAASALASVLPSRRIPCLVLSAKGRCIGTSVSMPLASRSHHVRCFTVNTFDVCFSAPTALRSPCQPHLDLNATQIIVIGV